MLKQKDVGKNRKQASGDLGVALPTKWGSKKSAAPGRKTCEECLLWKVFAVMGRGALVVVVPH